MAGMSHADILATLTKLVEDAQSDEGMLYTGLMRVVETLTQVGGQLHERAPDYEKPMIASTVVVLLTAIKAGTEEGPFVAEEDPKQEQELEEFEHSAHEPPTAQPTGQSG